MLFKVMPSQSVLVLRALHALCRKGDRPGRLYLKMYFLDLLKIKVTVAKDRVQAIREMTSRKSWRPIVPAVPLKRSARWNLDSSSPSVKDSSLAGWIVIPYDMAMVLLDFASQHMMLRKLSWNRSYQNPQLSIVEVTNSQSYQLERDATWISIAIIDFCSPTYSHPNTLKLIIAFCYVGHYRIYP